VADLTAHIPDALRASDAPTRRLVRRALVGLGIVAMLALAAWGAEKAIQPDALQAAFARVSWPWVAVAAVAYMLSQVSSALVWAVGLAAGGLGGVGRRHVLSAHWIGRGASELLPAQLGEAVRYAAIRRHPVAREGCGWRVAGSMGAFKLVDGLVTFVVVALAAIVMPLPDSVAGLRWVAGAVLAATVLFFWGVWRIGPARLTRFLPRFMGRPVDAFAQGAALLTRGRDTLIAVGLQLAAICARVVMIAALLHAFGIPAQAALLVLALMVLSGMLPISPGGVGVREAALVPVLVATYNLATEMALAFSLGVQATALAVSLTGAGLALAAQRLWPPARPAEAPETAPLAAASPAEPVPAHASAA
jgi:uncharacterized membrane protein YbhN (UPF0104 family)